MLHLGLINNFQVKIILRPNHLHAQTGAKQGLSNKTEECPWLPTFSLPEIKENEFTFLPILPFIKDYYIIGRVNVNSCAVDLR